MRSALIILALIMLPATGFSQTTWYVDDDNTSGPWIGSPIHPFKDIQAGIDQASPSDTVLVMDGCYRENIDFHGKGIAVVSKWGPKNAVIDGQKSGPTVRFATYEKSGIMQGPILCRPGLYTGGSLSWLTADAHAFPSIIGGTVGFR